MIPCRAGCTYAAIEQFTGLHEWITGGMSYVLSVGLNCTNCFVMMFCISKIVRNCVLALNLCNYFAACGGVIILRRNLWMTSVSSFMCVCPSIRISHLPLDEFLSN